MKIGTRHGLALQRVVELASNQYRALGVSLPPEFDDLLELAEEMLETAGDRVESQGWAVSPERVGRVNDGVLMNRQEVADHLGVSMDTVDRRVADGGLVATRIGARVMFKPSDVESFVNESRAA